MSDEDAAGVVGRIAGRIARAEPDHFVGSAVGTASDPTPRIYIKGAASAFVQDLVAKAAVPILVVDRQPYSFIELEDRVIQVQRALLRLGIEDFSVAVDVAGAGRIPVRVRLTATTPPEKDLLRAVPADLRPYVVITLDQDGDWEPDANSASPSTTMSPDPSASPAAGADIAPTAAWGPMAMVLDPLRDSLDQGFGPGTLTVGDACVTFHGPSGPDHTLVFRDWQVIWLPGSATIALWDPSGELAMLETGDRVVLGGFRPWDEDATGEPPAPAWLVRPGPDCPADLWLVHSARAAE